MFVLNQKKKNKSNNKNKTTNEWKEKIVRRINHYRISKPEREGVTGYERGS